MATVIFKGLARPDDPMFSSSFQLSSPQEAKRLASNSSKATPAKETEPVRAPPEKSGPTRKT